MAHTLLFPVWGGAKFNIFPIIRMLYLLFAAMWFLKLLSYHHIWHDVRHHVVLANKLDSEESDVKRERTTSYNASDVTLPRDRLSNGLNIPQYLLDSVLKYPSNVTLYDVIIFLLIPTLNYQLQYPYTKKFSFVKYVLWLMFYLVLLSIWVTIMLEYCMPLVLQCSFHFKREEYIDFLYNFIKLSVPNTYAWLIMFYGTFHVYLNAYAELTGFADKNFYDDWWNSKTLGEYWRKWNLPVHNWLTRHIYYPMIRRKYSRNVSMLAVFFFSALMHEYLVAGCIETVTMIGFNSMAFQVPFILIQERYKKYLGGMIGNIIFWVIFCVIGQPAGMVMGYIFLT